MSDASSPVIVKNFIDGKFVDAVDGRTIENPNPATNKILSIIPRSNSSDVELAVSAAKKAFSSWSRLPANDRADYLDRIAAAIDKHFNQLTKLESDDTGKPVSTAARVDIPRASHNFKFFAGALRHDSVSSTQFGNVLNYTQRTAIGVCGLITPWNLPIYLLSWNVAPALAMGNTVVCKPSELTPMTANALAQIIQDILPPGVFNIVHGYGPEVGNPLVAHPEVGVISFTGGTVTGKHVAQTAAPLMKKVGLECGGKNATVIFADCDWDLTLNGVFRSAFTNQGQVCLCGSRIFIESSIYDKFVAALVEKIKSTVVIGDPSDPSTTFGSLTSLAHRSKIESYVELARKDGAKIECGGKRPSLPAPFDQGAFYEPTIISGLEPSHKCATEEIFGPVVTVHKFETESEVLNYTNDLTKYGLAGSLWTSNLNKAHRVAQHWETGMLWVNCWLERDLRVPFGGIKESGIGTHGGSHSLDFYSHSKNIAINIPGLL